MSTILLIIHILLALIAVTTIVMYGSSPSRSLGWILITIILPFLGVLLYILFGVNRREFKLFRLKHAQKRKLFDKEYDFQSSLKRDLYFDSLNKNKIATLLFNSSGFLPYPGNKVTILEDGQTAFSTIFNKIDGAQRYVYMQYYMIEEGEILERLCNLIEKKIKEGVNFKIIYDSIGSSGLTNSTKERLKKLGVEIFPITPFKPGKLLYTLNYRNHRKIIIIDDSIGFTGGFNISDKYIKAESELGIWKDDHVCIEGPAVKSLLQIFIKDYYFASNNEEILKGLVTSEIPEQGNTTVQIVSGGPDYDYLSIMHQYLALIHHAEKQIYIANPYFIPSRSVLQALIMASLSGVKVSLLIPSKSDSKLTKNSMYSYFTEMLKAGIVINLQENFLHSKVIIIDDEIVSIGSGNFDHRSFEQNYETNALIYDKELVKNFSKKFETDCKNCRMLSLEEHESRPLINKLSENIARLFSPLL